MKPLTYKMKEALKELFLKEFEGEKYKAAYSDMLPEYTVSLKALWRRGIVDWKYLDFDKEVPGWEITPQGLMYFGIKPARPLLFQTLKRLSLTNSSKLEPVIIGDTVHSWHGIGWIIERKAAEEDRQKLYTLVEEVECLLSTQDRI